MNLVKYELEIPKESKEIIDLISVIFDKAKDGVQVEDLNAIIASLMLAIQGLDQVSDEIKSKNKDDLLAYMTKVLGEKFE